MACLHWCQQTIIYNSPNQLLQNGNNTILISTFYKFRLIAINSSNQIHRFISCSPTNIHIFFSNLEQNNFIFGLKVSFRLIAEQKTHRIDEDLKFLV